MKLFKSGLGSKEQDKALSREKFFLDEFGPLAAEWNQRLISSGMEPSQVHESAPGNEGASRYSPEQEHQFAMYARWLHKAESAQFEIGKGTSTRNKQIWSLFARGFTIREIADSLDIERRIVSRSITKLTERCHEDIRAGLLDADKDSRAEINEWTRLQAIKQKHLQLLASHSLGSTIVDSIIDSGVLTKLPLDQDVVDAFNESTAQIALALAAGE